MLCRKFSINCPLSPIPIMGLKKSKTALQASISMAANQKGTSGIFKILQETKKMIISKSTYPTEIE